MLEAYVPLYRKYRPQAFADVVGQAPTIQALSNAIRLEKVAHAYLFCGPRGTGKTSMARILAKSLNCEQGPTVTPCGVCATCVGVAQGNALDVIEFDAASNSGVESARELIEGVQFAPLAGRFKIYIIDEVHMLSSAAFNALLKTLEEPPPNVVFVFATTEAHKVLPTIVSRCQRFDFQRITTADICDRLAYVAQQEQIRIDAEALTQIARHARGGLRDALGLLDLLGVLSRSQPDRVLSRADVQLFTGALAEDALLAISQAVAQRDAHGLLTQLGQLSQQGMEPLPLLRELAHHYRNLLIIKASGGQVRAEVLDVSESFFQALQAQSAAYEAEVLPQILERLSSIERDIRLGQEAQLALEIGLVGLAYREDVHCYAELLARLERLEALLAQQPGALSATLPVVSQAVAPQALVATASPSLPESPAGVAVSPALPPAPVASQGYSSTAPSATEMESVPLLEPPMPEAIAPPPVRTAGDENLSAQFAAIVQRVASLSTKSLLGQQATLKAVEPNRLVVACGTEAIIATLQRSSHLLHLKKAAEQYYGKAMEVALVLEKKPMAPPPSGLLNPPPVTQSYPDSYLASHSAESSPAFPQTPAVTSSQLSTAPEPALSTVASGPSSAVAEALPVSAPVAQPPVSHQGEPAVWEESKQYVLEILQGRLME
ncbi:MAG: DNA polymerase III subunit gamma/tau [Candidatus Melainabacteria bacterium]|nr:DNA polymerase III subunit gamma/tau [Candidatus Melainabacteria bacterium]